MGYYGSGLLFERINIFMYLLGVVFFVGLMPIIVGISYYLELETHCLSKLYKKIASYMLIVLCCSPFIIGLVYAMFIKDHQAEIPIISYSKKEGTKNVARKYEEIQEEYIKAIENLKNKIETYREKMYIDIEDGREYRYEMEEYEELSEEYRELSEEYRELREDYIEALYDKVNKLEGEIEEEKRKNNLNTVFGVAATIVSGTSTTFIALFGKGVTKYLAKWAREKKNKRNRK